MPELSNERMNEIKNEVNKIIKLYNIPDFDFDLIKFLSTDEDFEIQMQYIDDDTTGLLFVDDNNKIVNSNSNRLIVINQKLINDEEFERKRRFICAHEYGHFVLHKKDSVTFARRDTKNKETIEEKEAEYFAYCLLLPENIIKLIFKNESTLNIVNNMVKDGMTYSEIIADLFNVSIKKANDRLKELNVLNSTN
ncbi:MAG: ImmA/IrrE family metallo-endopeptidase [Ruminococcus sp.]|nr:ImmA/IrrE family metallo-endopeptidase [Ruminococcus sp.]